MYNEVHMSSNKIVSGMITPDGTVLISHHRHDMVAHKDKNGEVYFLDGGLEYVRCSVNTILPQFISVLTTDPHAKKREWFEWGTYGVDGKSPLSYIKLKDMTTDHINAVLKTQKLSNNVINMFNNELTWRSLET